MSAKHNLHPLKIHNLGTYSPSTPPHLTIQSRHGALFQPTYQYHIIPPPYLTLSKTPANLTNNDQQKFNHNHAQEKQSKPLYRKKTRSTSHLRANTHLKGCYRNTLRLVCATNKHHECRSKRRFRSNPQGRIYV